MAVAWIAASGVTLLAAPASAQPPSAPRPEPSRISPASADPPPASPSHLRLDQQWTLPAAVEGVATERWSSPFRVDFAGLCPACGGEWATSRGAGDPWWLQVRARYERTGGGFSLGVLGRRNALLPLYSSMPIGGDYQPPLPSSATTDLTTTSIEWHLTAGVRRRLFTTADGSTLDAVADAIVPLNDAQIRAQTLLPRVPSKSIRVGLVLRP